MTRALHGMALFFGVLLRSDALHLVWKTAAEPQRHIIPSGNYGGGRIRNSVAATLGLGEPFVLPEP